MDSMSNREYHLSLISTYIFCKVFYSMSLYKRVCYDLGYILFSISNYDKELDALSDKELEEKLSSITKPQWYDKYEYIHKKRDIELLKALYKNPTTRTVDILYETLKANEPYHPLVFSYLYKCVEYSISFRKRVDFDLGNLEYFLDTDTSKVSTLSEKELEDKIDSIKAPWWNGIYKKISKNTKFLIILKKILSF